MPALRQCVTLLRAQKKSPGPLFKFLMSADVGHASISKVFKRLSRSTSRTDIDAVLSSLCMPHSNQVFPALPRTAYERRIIIQEGEDGGVVTLTEYMIAKLASEEKLKKRTSNKIIEMVLRDDFNPADIRTHRIQQIEAAIEKADGGSTLQFDLWKEADGQQDLKLYTRELMSIVEGLLADEGYAGYQYLGFEYLERNGSRVFGPANSTVWWQINATLIGPDRVLIGIAVFTDGSWNKNSLACEGVYGEPFVATER